MTTFIVSEKELADIVDTLILADEMIEDDPNNHWGPKYQQIEATIENIFKQAARY